MDRDFRFEQYLEVNGLENDEQNPVPFPPLSQKSAFNRSKPKGKLWTVCSGKGGVGKTFIASSLAITLAKLGHSVVLVDLDVTGANVHTNLGLQPSHLSIRHFFEGTKKINELTIRSQIPRLSCIQGFWDSWAPVQLTIDQIHQLTPQLKALPADYIIVDLGAGALDAHLELLKASDEKFLISNPEVTSIEKTYRFIEALVSYNLKENSTPESYAQLQNILRGHRQQKGTKPFSFRTYIKENANVSLDVFEGINSKPLRLIINSSRGESDVKIGHSMKIVCSKCYDLSLDYLGVIHYDNAVWQSAKDYKHALISQPFTPIAGQFLFTCKQLIAPEELRAVI